MKKYIFVIFLFISITFIYGQTESDFRVSLTSDNTGAVITSYTNRSLSVIRIPEIIQDFPVKEIGDRVFKNNTTITSVILPSTLEKIGDEAFNGCRNLTTVTIPASIVSIEFVTNLVKRRESGRDVEYNTTNFGDCNLTFSTQVALKQRGYPFKFYSKEIGYYTVQLLDDYTGLIITRFGNKNELNFNDLKTKSMTTISDVNIPSTMEGVSVKVIGSNSFQLPDNLRGKDVYSARIWIENRIVIPEGVEIIGEKAFSSSSSSFGQGFISVILPSTLKIIEKGAFSNCRNLNNILIPGNVILLGEDAFYRCEKLTQVNIQQNTQLNNRIIGNGAFSNCSKLNNVIIPEGITEIGEYAFSSCSSLTSITLPTTITKIGHRAFSYSGLTTIIIPETVGIIEFGDNIFQNTKFTLPIQADLRRRGYTGSF